MQPRLLEQIPRFGWSRKVLLNGVDLGDGGGADPAVTEAVRRPPGMFTAVVLGETSAGGSTGNGLFGFMLEGSNYGDESNPYEWFSIAEMAPNAYFTSPDPGNTIRLLGGAVPALTGFTYDGTSGSVNLARFQYLRVRSVIYDGEITVNAAPVGLGATVVISGGWGPSFALAMTQALTPAGGARTPGLNDYDNTLGAPNLIAADIAAAINDPANAFVTYVYATVVGAVVRIRPRTDNSFNSFSMYAGSPAEVSTSPVFDGLSIRLSGLQGDGEAFARVQTMVKLSGDPTIQYSNVIQRPEGSRYMTPSAKLTTATWDPANATGWTVRLFGAVDQQSVNAGAWVQLSALSLVAPIVGPPPPDGYTQLFVDKGIVMDMGPFNFFRFEVLPDGGVPPTVVSSYTIECVCAFDDNDWIDGEQSLSQLSTSLQSQFYQVQWLDPEPEVAGVITLTGRLVDMNGVPIANHILGQRTFFIILSVDFDDKDNNLHPTATATSTCLVGSVNNSNRIVVESRDGWFDVIVTGGAPGALVYVSADNYVQQGPGNAPLPAVMLSAEIETLNFA